MYPESRSAPEHLSPVAEGLAEPVREQKPREEKPAPAREPAKNTPFYADGWTPEITDDVDFEGMMAKFKKQSEEKMSDFKRSRDAKHGSYSRRR